MKPIPQKTSLFSFDTILEKADLKKGQIVADLGCGKSLFLLYALSTLVGQDGKVYGVDILPEIIDTVNREIHYHDLSSITPILGNLDSLRGVLIPDNHLDRGFLINTIHQSSDTITMLSEASRMLKKDGILVIVDWETHDSPIGPNKNQRIHHETIKETASIAKLELINEFKPGSYHYGLIFKKN
jgi:ubiquinone/menaquinone biosynthesis C-methylase UbiE